MPAADLPKALRMSANRDKKVTKGINMDIIDITNKKQIESCAILYVDVFSMIQRRSGYLIFLIHLDLSVYMCIKTLM
jgi:hypothetical protein